MKVLSRLDEVLLLTVLRLRDNAYGVSIIKDIYKRTGEKSVEKSVRQGKDERW